MLASPVISSSRRRRSRAGGRRRLLLAAALAIASLVPASAQAAFSGSSGKVAWEYDGQLTVDDPYDENPPMDIAEVPRAEKKLNPFSPTSAPAWSPDGTRIAFTQSLDDGVFPKHTAVFVATVKDGDEPTIRQVSTPYPGRLESCKTCDDAEETYDSAPVWTAGGEIAFVRKVGAESLAPHFGEVGTSVWTVSPEGGAASLLTHWDAHQDGLIQSIVWPTGSDQPVAIAATGAGLSLKTVKTKQQLAQEISIDDVDASPDGSRLAYRYATVLGARIKVIRTSNGETLDTIVPAISDTGVRFAPDGTRLIMAGCSDDAKGQQHCGFKTHRIEDPDAEVRSDDPVEQPYLDGKPAWAVGQNSALGLRSTMDVQSQDVPVIFIPGFLGSEIMCGAEKVWMPAVPPIHLEHVALAPDGKTEAACPQASPSGAEVNRFLGADVYGHATEWLRALKAHRKGDEDGFFTFGWDWRKSPTESLNALDERIDTMLKHTLPKDQGVRGVALVSHSFGSLLIRNYLDDGAHAKKVKRVLTVGAPWWGAPKPMFPIAFGIETPDFSPLDLFISNTNLRSFVVNSGGAYHLLPSDQYGGWLRYDGKPQNQTGVASFIDSVGGNAALLAQARAWHTTHDGFFDDDGRIDFRTVVGIGLPTVSGVNVAPTDSGRAQVGLVFGQGDGTVPVRSAVQGDEGTERPLGAHVHTQYRCGIPHMRQTADPITQRAYGDFLVSGSLPRKMPFTHCAARGQVVKVFRDVPMGQPTPSARSAGRSAAPLSLADAEFTNAADVIQLPGQTTIVTAGDDAVPVTWDAAGETFDLAPIDDAGAGTARTYGPVTGRVVVGGSPAEPRVTVDGRALAPNAGGDGEPVRDGETVAAPGAAGGARAPAPGTSGPRSITVALTVDRSLRPDAKGRVVVTLVAPAGVAGTVSIADRRGKALAPVASVRVGLSGRSRARLTLSRSVRSRVRHGRVAATVTARVQAASGARGAATRATTLR